MTGRRARAISAMSFGSASASGGTGVGAAPAGVVRLVLRRVGLLVGTGVLVGGVISWWAARFVQTLLYGLEPHDLSTLAAAALVLATVGTIAGWVPARRAARIDPGATLREG